MPGKTTYRQLKDDARDYYALCAQAERLGIATSLDDPATPATVDALRAAVNVKAVG